MSMSMKDLFILRNIVKLILKVWLNADFFQKTASISITLKESHAKKHSVKDRRHGNSHQKIVQMIFRYSHLTCTVVCKCAVESKVIYERHFCWTLMLYHRIGILRKPWEVIHLVKCQMVIFLLTFVALEIVGFIPTFHKSVLTGTSR